MKSRALRGKVYSKLIGRLFYQTIAILGAAVILVIVLREALRGNFADFLVWLIRILGGGRRSDDIYQLFVRNNIDIIIVVTMIIFFFILLRLSFSWFAKYFDQIVTGVDKLAEENDEAIVLNPKLKFMEIKLNEVKDKLKKRKEQAKAEEQRKNDLVVYLAHDIKTPLTSVIGYLSLLNEAPDMPAEQKAKYMGIALEKAYRLEKLISEFFEITRYNLQYMPLNKENINLCYMMVQIADEMYPQLAASGKQIQTDIKEDIIAYGDPEKLARVFNNILKNAIAYSPDNSVIDIRAAIVGDRVSIIFTNAGSIPKEKLASIFEKFYRLDSARSSDTGGSGLGLAIAKEIVISHGGRIYADSDGKQTSFTVELRAMTEQP